MDYNFLINSVQNDIIIHAIKANDLANSIDTIVNDIAKKSILSATQFVKIDNFIKIKNALLIHTQALDLQANSRIDNILGFLGLGKRASMLKLLRAQEELSNKINHEESKLFYQSFFYQKLLNSPIIHFEKFLTNNQDAVQFAQENNKDLLSWFDNKNAELNVLIDKNKIFSDRYFNLVAESEANIPEEIKKEINESKEKIKTLLEQVYTSPDSSQESLMIDILVITNSITDLIEQHTFNYWLNKIENYTK